MVYGTAPRDRVTTSYIPHKYMFVFHSIAHLHLVEELVVFHIQTNGHYVSKVTLLKHVCWDTVHPMYFYIIGFNKSLRIYTMTPE